MKPRVVSNLSVYRDEIVRATTITIVCGARIKVVVEQIKLYTHTNHATSALSLSLSSHLSSSIKTPRHLALIRSWDGLNWPAYPS